MKRILSAAFIALLSSGAYAADLGGLKDGSDPFAAPKGKVNWTGVYIGGSIGYGNANHELSLHDYFKEYCLPKSKAEDPEFDRFDGENYGSAKSWTLANKMEKVPFLYDADPASCEDLAKTSGTPPVTTNAGYVTVPGESREVLGVNGINSSGVIGDVQLGGDIQLNRFVFGLFGSYDFADMSTDVSVAGVNITAIERGDAWTIGGRAGVLLGSEQRTLLYGLVSYTEVEYNFIGLTATGDLTNKDVTFSGVKFGGGIEHALTNNIFIGVEVTHALLGEQTLFDYYDADTNTGARIKDEIGETVGKATVKVKVGNPLRPLE